MPYREVGMLQVNTQFRAYPKSFEQSVLDVPRSSVVQSVAYGNDRTTGKPEHGYIGFLGIGTETAFQGTKEGEWGNLLADQLSASFPRL